jgi:hypothetical protein
VPSDAESAAPLEHCFVLGCPRSGTTVLTRLLTSHPQVVIGMERYKFIFSELDRGQPVGDLAALFTPDRFEDFRPGDTNLRPPVFAAHYERAARRLAGGDVRYLGDKVAPCSPPVVAALERAFPTARFVLISRDPVSVASSYRQRARDPNDSWPARRTHRAAVSAWNMVTGAAEQLAGRVGPERLFALRFERLFTDGGASAARMFAFLDLDMTDSVKSRYEASAARAVSVRATGPVLSGRQRRYVTQRTDPGRLDRLDARLRTPA